MGDLDVSHTCAGQLSENEVMAAKMHQLGEQIGLENIVQYLFAAGVVAAVIMAVLGWNLLKKQRVQYKKKRQNRG